MRAALALPWLVLGVLVGGAGSPLALAESAPQRPSVLLGRVADAAGEPLPGLIVVATPVGRPLRHASVTDAQGRFRIEVSSGAALEASVVRGGVTVAAASAPSGDAELDLRVAEVRSGARLFSSAEWLSLLPEEARKRWFVLDCTGCHQFNETRALKDGAPRSAAQWDADSARMHARFGPGSGFPILSGHLAAEPLGEWLSAAISGPPPPRALPDVDSRYTLTEYDLPGPDLPHDLAIDSAGRALVTGMFTDRILVLEPGSGSIEPVEIPIEHANPRALEIDRAGNWWVLLGAANRVARFEPQRREWTSANVGMYGHSIGLDAEGAAWTNDHFARNGLRLARVTLGPAPEVSERTGPPFRTPARGPSPIPYELRVAPDGKVWTSLLHGNALAVFDPRSGLFASHPMPDPDAGPRRFDIDRDGRLWIPGYVSSALYRLDPGTGSFAKYPLPIRDALPYVVRVHPRTGDLWIGTGAADALFRFDPRRERFTAYPVATRGATMRHLAIDPASGDVWIAYGASPAIHPTRVARLAGVATGRPPAGAASTAP